METNGCGGWRRADAEDAGDVEGNERRMRMVVVGGKEHAGDERDLTRVA